MTVNEIREAREALENRILKLCEEFRAETGFAVDGLDVRTTQYSIYEDKYPRRVATAVIATLESI